MAEELFETYDADGQALGLVPRSDVHRRGLWHRAVNVFLFDPAGELYLQRRAAAKDVAPGLWDLSVAEHLIPGESYEEGALRGLAEELGVTGVRLAAFDGEFRHQLCLGPIRDFEMQRCFRGRYDGAVHLDPVEVDAVRTITRERLIESLDEDPEAYTPWLRQHIIDVDLLDSGWPG